MNKKRILQIMVAASIITGNVVSAEVANAVEVNEEKTSLQELDSVEYSNEDSSQKEEKKSSLDTEKTQVQSAELKLDSKETKVEEAGSGVNRGQVVNVTTSLRVRSSASLSSSVLDYIKNGTIVQIISKSGEWYKVNTGAVTGYIHSDYIKVVSGGASAQVSSQTNVQGTVVNISTSLNVRNGASTSNAVIGYLTNGTKVTITGESGNWYAISSNGTEGYVSKDYVSKGTKTANNANTQVQATTSTQATVVNVSTNLRVRSGASSSSTVIGYLTNATKVTITGESGNWYVISYNGKTGYVSKDYVSKGSSSGSSAGNAQAPSRGGQALTNKTGVVNVSSSLRLRSGASLNAQVIGNLSSGESVTITGTSGDFYKVSYNGMVGYASSQYISVGGSSTSSSKYTTVYNSMISQLGTPYCWGGNGESLTTSALNRLKAAFPSYAASGSYSRIAGYVNQGYKAFDCSGLMQWGFAQAGITIGRTTWDQIGNGVGVSLNNLKPGDLLFYSNLQHVGMYIGNGQWIEAPNKNANVRVINVPWSLIGQARRIL